MFLPRAHALLVAAAALVLLGAGCESPYNVDTFVVLDNDYPQASALVVYQAFWQAIPFSTPVPPGSTSDPQGTIPASENTAYVVLAPGWDPAATPKPTAFVVLESQQGFGLHIGDTLHIPVSDAAFVGNCAAGSHLSQQEADFITQIVFASTFAGLRYDATTCKTTRAPTGDAGAH
jgi:hypothetical protein